MSESTWPRNSIDEVSHLSRDVSERHFDLQVAMVGFFIEAEWGNSVPDATYLRIFADMQRLTRAISVLRLALMSFRTTAKMPAVNPAEEGGDE